MKKILLILCCFSLQLYPYSQEEVAALKETVVLARKGAFGWCSTEKISSFIDLVLEVEPEICVEIGVYGGASILPVAYALKFLRNGIIVAIDPWDFVECVRHIDPVKDPQAWKTWLGVDMDVVHAEFLSLLHKNGLEDVCLPVRSTSEKAANEVLENIDILHIDGDHSEYGSLRDVELYLPKVRPGGYIWLTDAIWQERNQAVDYLLERCVFVKWIDNCSTFLFRKK